MPFSILTFNVNGLRSIRDYYAQSKLVPCAAFADFLNTLGADILCMQEHKTNTAQKLDFELSQPAGYAAFYSFPRVPKKIGYSGVVTFVKSSTGWLPTSWSDTLMPRQSAPHAWMQTSPLLMTHFRESELKDLDSEGRVMVTDHSYFLLLNIYFPNDSGPDRHDFRRRFYYAVQLRCLDLIREHRRSLILAGDLNIAYHPLDHCDYSRAFLSSGMGVLGPIKAGLQDPELSLETWPVFLRDFYENPMRRWLAQWLFTGTSQLSWRDEEEDHLVCVMSMGGDEQWTDCYRVLHPFDSAQERYTCWNTLISARGSNHGTRIDHIITTGPAFRLGAVELVESEVLAGVMGSDHCPVRCRWMVSDALVATHGAGYAQSQMQQGNIPRAYGRMDQFFRKRDQPENAEPAALSAGKARKTAKSTILDYFDRVPRAAPEAAIPEAADEGGEGVRVRGLDAAGSGLAALFSTEKKRPVPRCRGHDEPCVLLRVTKAGRNQGRQFFMCSRPVGVAGDGAARCTHFEWYNKDRRQDR